jgi:hypothetical protein
MLFAYALPRRADCLATRVVPSRRELRELPQVALRANG